MIIIFGQLNKITASYIKFNNNIILVDIFNLYLKDDSNEYAVKLSNKKIRKDLLPLHFRYYNDIFKQCLAYN